MQYRSIPIAIELGKPPLKFKNVAAVQYTDVFIEPSMVRLGDILNAVYMGGIILIRLPHPRLAKSLSNHAQLNADPTTKISCTFFVGSDRSLVPWLDEMFYDWTDDYSEFLQRQLPSIYRTR